MQSCKEQKGRKGPKGQRKPLKPFRYGLKRLLSPFCLLCPLSPFRSHLVRAMPPYAAAAAKRISGIFSLLTEASEKYLPKLTRLVSIDTTIGATPR